MLSYGSKDVWNPIERRIRCADLNNYIKLAKMFCWENKNPHSRVILLSEGYILGIIVEEEIQSIP